MIHLRNLHLSFGGEPLFNGLTWSIRPGERTALIGPNGAGKSTLLRIINGLQTVDEGEVAREGGVRVGYLAQDIQELDLKQTPVEEAMQAFSNVLDLEKAASSLTREMEAHPDHTSDDYLSIVERFSRVQHQLDAYEAHTIETQAASVLSGLGFTDEEMQRPLSTFSGGWRMRVSLARLLLGNPDVLLLDEPTNHLDIESIAWLEEYLKAYEGAVVIVSHDRTFLERMTNRTAEIVRNQIEEYEGNYTFYLQERVERRKIWEASYQNQQKMIADTERFIERFRYKASKAAQVQSRIKMLDKLERIPPPPPRQAEIQFRFPEPPRATRILAKVSTFGKRYPTQETVPIVVFDDAGPLVIERGDKIALVGKNGAGKSTLARILLGTEPFTGEREVGPRTQASFFAQHQAESLDAQLTVLETLRLSSPGHSETKLRSILGTFLFTGNDVFKHVKVLSGGERSRLALARTLLSPANLLILDEPTNHLDIASREVLAEALRQYAGAFVLISHDRHFLDAVCNQVWYLENQIVRTYRGTFSEAQWQREHGTGAAHPNKEAPSPSSSTKTITKPKKHGGRKSKEQKRREAEARNRLYRMIRNGNEIDPSTIDPELLPRALKMIEEKIEKQETERNALEKRLADPTLYDDNTAFQSAMSDFRATEKRLKALMEQWEALAVAIE